jgi:hypothetical protein
MALIWDIAGLLNWAGDIKQRPHKYEMAGLPKDELLVSSVFVLIKFIK